MSTSLIRNRIRVHQWPFFYGWVILFAGAVGTLLSVPGQTMGISVFTESLILSLELPRLRLSFAYMIGTILSSLLLSRAGKIYDRFGARITASVSGTVLAIALVFLSFIAPLGRVLDRLISFSHWNFILIILGFFMIRLSGQGVLTMVSKSMVMKWFDKKRGIVAAFLGISTTFGFSYAPRILDSLVTRWDYQGAWRFMAIICGVLFPLFALLVFRDNPESCLLKPDGENSSQENSNKNSTAQDEVPEKEMTLKQAKRNPLLWLFAMGLALWALFNTALTFNIVSIFKTSGLTKEIAISIFLPVSVVSIIFRFTISWLSNRIKLELIFLFQLAFMLVASTALFFLHGLFSRILLVVGLGVAGGLFGVLNSISWVRLFGRKHLGAITGFSMGWIVAGSAVGPYFFSLSLKWSGGYRGGAVLVQILGAGIFLAIIIYTMINKSKNMIQQNSHRNK